MAACGGFNNIDCSAKKNPALRYSVRKTDTIRAQGSRVFDNATSMISVLGLRLQRENTP